jgi:hypothetical protein
MGRRGDLRLATLDAMMRTLAAFFVVAMIGGCQREDAELAEEAAELVVPAEPTTLVRKGSDKCLDVDAASTANGAKIQQWSCNGTSAQRFTIEDRGNGNYRLRNASSNKCLDVAAGGTSNGTKIQQWSCGTGGSQRFRIDDLDAGYVRLRHPGSGKCVDVNAASSADGAQVQLWTCNGTSAQAWKLGGTTTPPPPPGPVWRTANLTYFTSYPDPGSEECTEYNGCMWAGYFAFVAGKQTEAWVMQHNIAAVHSRDANTYANKTLRVRQGSKQIDVTVYDMCSDSDCDGCCTRNASQTGFLLDLESYTAERFGASDGIVEWTCLDCP